MISVQKKLICIKCNYFNVSPDCSHCEKCLKHELSGMIEEANIEILKIGPEKKIFREVN